MESQESVELKNYDLYLLAFSGGKDSTASFLYLLDQGIDPRQIELFHHEVDGREGSTLMDWPSTPAYCRAFARAFGVPICFSWRHGGFEREMLRDGTPTAPISWENPDRTIGTTGGRGPKGTRLRFPQVSAALSCRWCSAYLKIDVASASIRNQDRFMGKRTLLISGERAEESPARARYKVFEPDRTSTEKRHVDRFRPVHGWVEQQVWDILERYRINAHPAYRLGFSRLSCRACIFGGPDLWASIRKIDPTGFQVIAEYEERFGVTIHRKKSVVSLADAGQPYKGCSDPALVAEALDTTWERAIILPDGEWSIPCGAFGQGGGPP